jgi:hypothetical protein
MIHNTRTSLSVGIDIKKVNMSPWFTETTKWNGRLAPLFPKWNDMDISFVFSKKM